MNELSTRQDHIEQDYKLSLCSSCFLNVAADRYKSKPADVLEHTHKAVLSPGAAVPDQSSSLRASGWQLGERPHSLQRGDQTSRPHGTRWELLFTVDLQRFYRCVDECYSASRSETLLILTSTNALLHPLSYYRV